MCIHLRLGHLYKVELRFVFCELLRHRRVVSESGRLDWRCDQLDKPVVGLGDLTSQVVKVGRWHFWLACLMGSRVRMVDVLQGAQEKLNMLVDVLTNFLQTVFRWLLLHHLLLLLDRIETSWRCRSSTAFEGVELLLLLRLWKAVLHLLLLKVVVVHLLEGVVPARVDHLSCLVYVH